MEAEPVKSRNVNGIHLERNLGHLGANLFHADLDDGADIRISPRAIVKTNKVNNPNP